MAMTVFDVLAPWSAINAALGLSTPIRDQAHYTGLLTFVDECFERFGSDGAHPVFALVDLVAKRIAVNKEQFVVDFLLAPP
jgi:HTH-type transcriptional regulator / antitoxin HigA